MKNKRWKRQAKRIKGICISKGDKCSSRCPMRVKCDELLGFKIPIEVQIRELEQLCKGGN